MPKSASSPKISRQATSDAIARAELAEARLRATRANEQRRLVNTLSKRTQSRPTPEQVLGVPGREYMSLSGSYTAARPDRSRSGPVPVAASADAHLDEGQHDNLRRFCQDIYRNNEVAGILIDRLADAVIGEDGPTLMCMSEDEAFNSEAEEYFWRWCEQPEITGQKRAADLLRDMIADICTDGDIGYALTDREKVQAIEGELIKQPAVVLQNGFRGPSSMKTDAGTTIVRGVEFGAGGEVLRYHVAEYGLGGAIDRGRFRPVPAESMILARSPFGRKSNQTRGLPCLARSLARLSQFEQYQDSALLASIIGCSQAMFIKSKSPGLTEETLTGAADQDEAAESERAYPLTDIAPGTISYLGLDEDMGQFNPSHPTTTHDAFSTFQIRLLGAGIGLPIELTLLDSSKSNYYGTRAALANTYRGLAPWRRLVCQVMTRFYRWIIGGAMDAGRIRFVKDWTRIDWICQPPPMIKVGEEIGGIADGIDRLLFTRNEGLIMARGNTFDDFLKRRKRELELERKAGLAPVTMPGAGGAGGAGGTPAGAGKPEQQDAPDEAQEDETGEAVKEEEAAV